MKSKRTCKPYTTEEDLWIIENYRSFDNFRELVEEHNKLFTPRKYQNILRHTREKLGITDPMVERFTKDESNWLRENYESYDHFTELVGAFITKFGKRSYDSIRKHMRLVLKIDFSYQHNYTPEENEWLRNNVAGKTADEIADEFNRYFGTDITRRAIDYHRHQINAYMDNNGRIDGTWAEKYNAKPLYSEQRLGKDILIKTGCEGGYEHTKGWELKSHYVWRKHYGEEVPADHCVIFLDDDHENFDIDNLYCCPRRVMSSACASARDWKTADVEVKKEYLAIAELTTLLKERRD